MLFMNFIFVHTIRVRSDSIRFLRLCSSCFRNVCVCVCIDILFCNSIDRKFRFPVLIRSVFIIHTSTCYESVAHCHRVYTWVLACTPSTFLAMLELTVFALNYSHFFLCTSTRFMSLWWGGGLFKPLTIWFNFLQLHTTTGNVTVK